MSAPPAPAHRRPPADLLDAGALPPVLPDVRRIAVLRANGLGDLMFAMPALEALRAAYPEASITLLAMPWHVAFFDGRPAPFDRVIAVPPCEGVRDEPGAGEQPEVLERFFEAMRGEAFDLAVQLHGGGRHSNPFVRRLGARVSAGLRSPEAMPLDVEVPYVYFQSEVMRFLEVAASLGALPVVLEPRIEVTEVDRREAEAALGPGDDGRPLLVVHPGAGDGRRRWSAQGFAHVADAAAGAGARVVLVGGRGDATLTAAVRASMQAPALDLAGRLSLGGLAGVAERCAVFLGNDSGPMHFARAVGASTVGIYWCGNLINAGGATRTRHRPVLSFRLDCPACGVDTTRVRCGHQESLVSDVPVDEVQEHVLELLRFGTPAHAQVSDAAGGC